METALLLVAVVIAGLACPAMMWWQRRRGEDAVCCVPARRGRDASPSADAADLRRRNAELEDRIARLRAEQGR